MRRYSMFTVSLTASANYRWFASCGHLETADRGPCCCEWAHNNNVTNRDSILARISIKRPYRAARISETAAPPPPSLSYRKSICLEYQNSGTLCLANPYPANYSTSFCLYTIEYLFEENF